MLGCACVAAGVGCVWCFCVSVCVRECGEAGYLRDSYSCRLGALGCGGTEGYSASLSLLQGEESTHLGKEVLLKSVALSPSSCPTSPWYVLSKQASIIYYFCEVRIWFLSYRQGLGHGTGDGFGQDCVWDMGLYESGPDQTWLTGSSKGEALFAVVGTGDRGTPSQRYTGYEAETPRVKVCLL